MFKAFDRRAFLTAAAALATPVALAASTARAQPVVSPPTVPQGELIYANKLASEKDVAGFRLEGEALIDFDLGKMRMKNKLPVAEVAAGVPNTASNFVYWCPEVFPDDIDISWNFTVISEPGLCILFFAARGILPGGGDASVFDPRLKPRNGVYEQYTQSDVSALQMAYFRRRWDTERAFHLCNLRRAPGFEMLAQGADPLPDVADAKPPYRVRLIKRATGVSFYINDLLVVDWTAGSPAPRPQWPGAGSIGFRQMAPLVATYSDLEVRRVV